MKKLWEYILRQFGRDPDNDYLDADEDCECGTMINYVVPGEKIDRQIDDAI